MTRKDIIQLGVLPAIILGLLGFTSAVKIVVFISSLMGFQFRIISVAGLNSYAIMIAILFALCPILAFLLYSRKYQAVSYTYPITMHLRYLVYLVLGVIGSIAVDVGQIKLFRMQLVELSAEAANWTSFIEHLSPFSYGITAILIIGAAIFFTQKIAKE